MLSCLLCYLSFSRTEDLGSGLVSWFIGFSVIHERLVRRSPDCNVLFLFTWVSLIHTYRLHFCSRCKWGLMPASFEILRISPVCPKSSLMKLSERCGGSLWKTRKHFTDDKALSPPPLSSTLSLALLQSLLLRPFFISSISLSFMGDYVAVWSAERRMTVIL